MVQNVYKVNAPFLNGRYGILGISSRGFDLKLVNSPSFVYPILWLSHDLALVEQSKSFDGGDFFYFGKEMG